MASIAILKITAPYHDKKRMAKFKNLLDIIQDMLSKKQYQGVLDKIGKERVLRNQYKLSPGLRREIAEIEVMCFEKVNKIEEAVIALAGHLASTYKNKEWPIDLYEKWIGLYKSIGPLSIEKFYFCECCGLHPDTKLLLDSAIEMGCQPPIGYPGQCKSAIAIHFGSKKTRKKYKVG